MKGTARWFLVGVCALALGLWSVFSTAPWGWGWAMITGLGGLFWLLRGGGGFWRGAYLGGVFMWGYMSFGCWWVSEAFAHGPEASRGLGGAAALALGLLCAVPAASAAGVWSRWLRRGDWRDAMSFAGALGAAEWFRGYWLSGFPWNEFGMGFARSDELLQTASVLGVHGLTLLALLSGASLGALAFTSAGAGERRVFLGAWGGLCVLFVWGWFRLEGAELEEEVVRVRVVQPSIAQEEKWKPEFARRNYEVLTRLTSRADELGVEAVIWPESAPTIPFTREEAARAYDLAPRTTRALLTGAARGGVGGEAYNSVAAFGYGGEVLGVYDKVRLVPYGEYLPLSWLLGRLGFGKLVLGEGFAFGGERKLLDLGDAGKVGVMICYESIFSRYGGYEDGEADWLLVASNDAWFGSSRGPHQHLDHARMRAAERGLGLARAANDGISALVDPYGRVEASLGRYERGVLDGAVRRRLDWTFYGLFGDVWFWLASLGFMGLGLWGARRR